MTIQLNTGHAPRAAEPMTESTWYDESLGFDPRNDDLFGAPGDEDEDDDPDEDDDDYLD